LKQVLQHVNDAELEEHFDISATFCMENCENGPSVRINGHLIKHATMDLVKEKIASAAAGNLPAAEAGHACRA
jgi:NADH:ubiquinone oxidoreductase subunit E